MVSLVEASAHLNGEFRRIRVGRGRRRTALLECRVQQSSPQLPDGCGQQMTDKMGCFGPYGWKKQHQQWRKSGNITRFWLQKFYDRRCCCRKKLQFIIVVFNWLVLLTSTCTSLPLQLNLTTEHSKRFYWSLFWSCRSLRSSIGWRRSSVSFIMSVFRRRVRDSTKQLHFLVAVSYKRVILALLQHTSTASSDNDQGVIVIYLPLLIRSVSYAVLQHCTFLVISHLSIKGKKPFLCDLQ